MSLLTRSFDFHRCLQTNVVNTPLSFILLNDLEELVQHPTHIPDRLGDKPNILGVFLTFTFAVYPLNSVLSWIPPDSSGPTEKELFLSLCLSSEGRPDEALLWFLVEILMLPVRDSNVRGKRIAGAIVSRMTANIPNTYLFLVFKGPGSITLVLLYTVRHRQFCSRKCPTSVKGMGCAVRGSQLQL